MQRRRMLFWVSLGMFTVGERLGLDGLDRLAAAVIRPRRGGNANSARRPATTLTPTEEPLEATTSSVAPVDDPEDDDEPGSASPARRARHGRPPSRWLRSLEAAELRIWLKTIDPPEAGVSGMTFWTHLTRDHSFDAKKIEGLNETEQAKLHAAAHDGY